MRKLGKSLVLALVLVFLASTVAVQIAIAKAQPKTLMVPDDYSSLASAVANATDGDTIKVRSGTYQENGINTNKSITIVGEGYETTKINFQTRSYSVDVNIFEKYTFYDPAISVNASNFRLSGLTVTSNGGDVLINGNNTVINGCNFENKFGISGAYQLVSGNLFSIVGLNANYSKISENKITNELGIGGQYTIFSFNNIAASGMTIDTNNSWICNNSFGNSPYAILPLNGNNNIFSHNIIDHFSFGLWVRGSNNTIMLNQITYCGVALEPSPNNTYYANYLANNLWGIDTVGSLLNPNGNESVLFQNNLVNNVYQVSTVTHYKSDYFDNGKEGNYWSNYNGSDADRDGIGDTPYTIDANRLDRYPLMTPVNMSEVPDLIPEWARPPSIKLINPTETDYSAGEIALDFVIDKRPTWIGYSLDGQNNITITGNTTLTNLKTGTHSITIYTTDFYQNTGASKTIDFKFSQAFPTAIVIALISAIVSVVVVYLILYRKYRRPRRISV